MENSPQVSINWIIWRRIILIVGGVGLIIFGILLLTHTIHLDKPPQPTESKITATSDLPTIPVTFETIASHDGDKVSIEGVIWLGNSVSCGNYACYNDPDDMHLCCKLRLVGDDHNYNPGITIVLIQSSVIKNEPNSFDLPDQFSPNDLRIYTDSGQILTINDHIRLTGMSHGTSASSTEGLEDIYLYVMKIEPGE